ncbi:MAG: hypothetical protein AAFY17_01245 [Cyanobacteria bacterium J06642_11]
MSLRTSHPASAPPECHIQQDEVLKLSGPERAWQIHSGTLALCRTVDGIRRCFFTAHAGEVIFGGIEQESGMFAIAIEPVVIQAIP